ncbi:MAG: GNAT family N-acetyltransferase [Phenylobacterium sp.]|jgi:RimJ/RimL family protein N-acetyltransferase|nr:GNAT family N-acetyltransferase [Phenylobacterium sp.]
MTAAATPAQTVLSGAFVTLRPLAVADAAMTFRWRHDDRARYLNKAAPTVADQARWIAARPPAEYNFIIELKDGAPIGMVALLEIDAANRRAEAGRFLIGEAQAARGVPAAVEAMKLVYELAFDTLGLERIHGLIGADNHLMLKWQLFLGMKEEGRLRRHYFKDGEFIDAIALGLLASEYRAVARPRMLGLIAAGRPARAAQ